tara:strand:- start:228 stop:1349 length:1122 start_codon:yes stop_codon:yes gene_type:complete
LKKINFIDLNRQYKSLRSEIDMSISEVIEKANFIQGEEVKIFEQKLKEYVSANALTVANGTDALFISLRALGIGPGDEVITPSFTWVSTVETIKLVGAQPIFCDISKETFNLDENLLEELITDKTKAIMPVSLFGRCPDLKRINEIAKKFKIFTIEDAAQSFGAKSSGRMSCSIADISTTSFFPAKPLGCYGDGGAIFSNNDQLFEEASIISKHGQKGRYNYLTIGVNSRLDTIQAAILIQKLRVFESEIKRRNEIASKYNNLLSSSGYIDCPEIPNDDNRSVWAQYTIILDKDFIGKREEIMNLLKEDGVPSALYYPAALHLQRPYFSDIRLEITEDIAKRVISLPMHPYLEDEEVEYITDSFLNALKHSAL